MIAVLLIISAIIALQSSFVQTRIADQVLSTLESHIDGTVSIGKIHFDPFKALVIRDISIIDRTPYIDSASHVAHMSHIDGTPLADSAVAAPVDTMFHAEYVTASFSLKDLISGFPTRLKSVEVTGGWFTLTLEPYEEGEIPPFNLRRIFRLVPKDGKKSRSKKEIFHISGVSLEDMAFRLYNYRKRIDKEFPEGSIDWTDLEIEDISLSGHNLRMKGPVMYGVCDHLSFREKSGYTCSNISGSVRAGDGSVLVAGLTLQDGMSDLSIPSFEMTYADSDAWSEFITEVRMKADISESIVSMESLGYFAPSLKKFSMTASVEGEMEGYVNDLHFKDIHFKTTDKTSLPIVEKDWYRGIKGTADGSIVGLPDSKAMLTDFRVKNASFTSWGLERFLKCWNPHIKLSLGEYCKGERLYFTGHARGPLNRLTARGILHAAGGEIKTVLDIRNVADKRRPIEMRGTLTGKGVDIAKASGRDLPIGQCDIRTGLSAKLSDGVPDIVIDSLFIDRLGVHGYEYTGIAANGRYSGNAFDGRIVCNDPNLNLLFQGIFTLSSKTNNSIYRFYANVGYADLGALGLMHRKEMAKVSFSTNADFTRIRGKEILGNIGIGNIQLEDGQGIHDVGDIRISSHSADTVSRISFISGFADGSYTGSRFVNFFVKDLNAASSGRALPSLGCTENSEYKRNRYKVSLRFHDTMRLLSFFAPGSYIADSTCLDINLDRGGHLDATLKSSRLAYRDRYLKDVSVKTKNAGDSLRLSLTAGEISVGPALTRANRLKIDMHRDSIFLSYKYDNDDGGKNMASLSIDGNIGRDSSDSLFLGMRIVPSYINLDSKRWDMESDTIMLRRGAIDIRKFSIRSRDEVISMHGGWAASAPDTMQVNLSGYDISTLNAFIGKNYGIAGRLTGHAMIVSPTDSRAGILMNMVCDSAAFGGHGLGTLKIAGVWDESRKGFNYVLRNSMNNIQNIYAFGNYFPQTKSIEGKLSLNALDMGYATPFVKSIFDEFGGKLSGDIAFIGPVDNVDIASRGLRIDGGRLRIGFTNVAYNVDGPLDMNDLGLNFNGLSITDRFGNKGSVNGKIGWKGFRDIRFDTGITFSSLEVINSSESQSPMFYGNVSATGRLDITGPVHALSLNASAMTENRGSLHIPIRRTASAAISDLLTFKMQEKKVVTDPYEEMMGKLKEKEKQSSDLAVHLDIVATPGVTATIEIDKSTGNILTGNGNGVITMDIRPSRGIFNIGGNYNITDGIYHFVALGIAKRDFNIREGSSIRFNGDIMDSDLNINAIYRTKASVGVLIADTTSTSTRRTVECGISITDKIRNPRLGFSINIPDLDPTTQSRVESALSTQDKIQRQLLALLVTNSFLPDEQSGVTNTSSSMLFSSVSEIMSGQLNSILQKLDIPLDLGLDYQQDMRGSDIFDVALSTALFNNRVIVNGTIGNSQYNSGTTSSEMVGDLDIDVKLDKQGALRLNMFSHSADQYSSYLDNSQRNGLGLTFQKEYNTFGEFVRRLFMSRSRKREEALKEISDDRKVKIKILADDRRKYKKDRRAEARKER